jgi:hypothetical protein
VNAQLWLPFTLQKLASPLALLDGSTPAMFTDVVENYGAPLPLQPRKKKITQITRNRKNRNLAIPADAD